MKHRREIAGLSLLFLAAFLFLAVFSFDAADPSFNQAVKADWKVRNLAGAAGSYCVGLLVDLFGLGVVVWPFLLLYFGVSRFVERIRASWVRWTGFWGLYVSLLAWASHPWFSSGQKTYGISGGGFLGREILARLTIPTLRPAGAFLFWLFATAVSAQLLFGFSWPEVYKRALSLGHDLWRKWRERRERTARRAAAKPERPAPRPRPEPLLLGEDLELKPLAETQAQKAAAPRPAPAGPPKDDGALPDPALLTVPPRSETRVEPKAMQALSETLVACLNDFGIQGEIKQVTPGPVVTMFEFKPAPGVKISRIAALSDDIALALKALSVRIEAPILGKDSVGVEIPNAVRETVFLREIIDSEVFRSSRSPLTLALGKDIRGAVQVADLARMPHLLVAGATGAGKSVCLSAIMLSLLFKASPRRVKLLLVDPKRIEFAAYAKLPHLVHPVVTDPVLAKSALEWAVCEMEARYEAMSRLSVRNIEGYNEALAERGASLAPELADLSPMPYLVIVIDELADMMMTAAKEVELCIVRLAQLARAAGIHLVLATQRPSVDVVTGLIKTNFPTRISFQVSSRPDSRTILDTVGAERLLGLGDMLFRPGGSKLVRLHGAFVDEREIAAVVGFWTGREAQSFELDFGEWRKGLGAENGGAGEFAGGLTDDPAYREAVQFVVSQGKASISLIQRRFRIGFNRAARFIEQMEADGLLGPQDGSKPRAVIRGRE